MVAGHEGNSSVRHLTSEGTNSESAAELHPTFFFWSLPVDAVASSVSASAHLSDAVTVRYQWLLLPQFW